MSGGTGRSNATDGSARDVGPAADAGSTTRTGSSAESGPPTDARSTAGPVLNVGAGEQGDGDVTLDLLSSVDPDVQGTATALPFADGTFDVVEMDQVLEHVPPGNLGDVFEECYRVLGLEAWVPHAASRLYDQDPTHRSSWTYGTPEYFADGSFSWYYDDREFAFDLVDREMTVWVLEGAPLSGVRSVLLQTVHRLLEWTDGVVYRPSISGSIHFTLRKV